MTCCKWEKCVVWESDFFMEDFFMGSRHFRMAGIAVFWFGEFFGLWFLSIF
jgi:hypothetical protein